MTLVSSFLTSRQSFDRAGAGTALQPHSGLTNSVVHIRASDCKDFYCRAYGQSRGILSDLLSGFCEKFYSYHSPRLSVVYFIEKWKWYWKMIT